MTYEEMGAMMTSDLAKELFDLAYSSGVAAERERCARVCEEFYSIEEVAQKCAAAIRKGE